jgi:hypothetical protein
MPLNIGPNPNFMQRMMGGINAAGQSMGGPAGQAAKVSAGFNQRRLNRPAVLPNRETMPNTGMMPFGSSSMNPGMTMQPPSPQPDMDGSPTMPFVQGPSTMPNFLNSVNKGGMMGGFPRPQIDTGNVMNDNQMAGGLWNKYRTMGQPMSPMFR